MDVLKVLYFGNESVRIVCRVCLVLVSIAGLSACGVWFTGLPTGTRSYALGVFVAVLLICGLSSLVLVTLLGGGYLIYAAISIFVIRRFRRLFGFLPPTTTAGRDALQTTVDRRLVGAAGWFFQLCAQEESLASALASLSQGSHETAPSPDTVADMETKLRENKKDLMSSKNSFWRLHKAARSKYLPVPFETCPSVKDYRELSANGRAVCKERKKKESALQAPRSPDGPGVRDPD